ncbi:Chitin synthase regulatory factor 4 [Smittium culicis]|uniref:Chitin synthase regulatory factor 4 n=2 Tax=Smittium culicis TaxID=133412 RepID=A0A1R1Y7J2_9FUNG|nr:Chitin synthase regulatory factor 4 [Smittium culicis]
MLRNKYFTPLLQLNSNKNQVLASENIPADFGFARPEINSFELDKILSSTSNRNSDLILPLPKKPNHFSNNKHWSHISFETLENADSFSNAYRSNNGSSKTLVLSKNLNSELFYEMENNIRPPKKSSKIERRSIIAYKKHSSTFQDSPLISRSGGFSIDSSFNYENISKKEIFSHKSVSEVNLGNISLNNDPIPSPKATTKFAHRRPPSVQKLNHLPTHNFISKPKHFSMYTTTQSFDSHFIQKSDSKDTTVDSKFRPSLDGEVSGSLNRYENSSNDYNASQINSPNSTNADSFFSSYPKNLPSPIQRNSETFISEKINDTYKKLNNSVAKMHNIFMSDINSSSQSESVPVVEYGNIETYNKLAKNFKNDHDRFSKQFKFAKYLIVAAEGLSDIRENLSRFQRMSFFLKSKLSIFTKKTDSDRIICLAVYWINRLSKSKHTDAMYIKAGWVSSGTFGFKKDQKLSLSIFSQAADLGHSPSALKVASYHESTGNYKSALNWYSKATHLNEPFAVYRLACAYLVGELGVLANLEYSYAYFKTAAFLANKDCPYGAYFLALMYLGEPPVPIDVSSVIPYSPSEAEKLLHKAASLSYHQANYHLGCLYESGQHGFKVDPHSAIKYYLIASDLGNLDSLYSLANIYRNGYKNIICVDLEKSFAYCQKAAHLGHPHSMSLMGWFHDPENSIITDSSEDCKTDSMVVVKSYAVARGWYKTAAVKGVPEATEWLNCTRNL